jgi:hypothetical protein
VSGWVILAVHWLDQINECHCGLNAVAVIFTTSTYQHMTFEQEFCMVVCCSTLLHAMITSRHEAHGRTRRGAKRTIRLRDGVVRRVLTVLVLNF